MRLEYDRDIDAAYIYFKDIIEGEVTQTISLNDEINLDLNKEGKTLGIEILNASQNLPKNSLKSVN